MFNAIAVRGHVNGTATMVVLIEHSGDINCDSPSYCCSKDMAKNPPVVTWYKSWHLPRLQKTIGMKSCARFWKQPKPSGYRCVLSNRRTSLNCWIRILQERLFEQCLSVISQAAEFLDHFSPYTKAPRTCVYREKKFAISRKLIYDGVENAINAQCTDNPKSLDMENRCWLTFVSSKWTTRILSGQRYAHAYSSWYTDYAERHPGSGWRYAMCEQVLCLGLRTGWDSSWWIYRGYNWRTSSGDCRYALLRLFRDCKIRPKKFGAGQSTWRCDV